jgi:hypothetical protein
MKFIFRDDDDNADETDRIENTTIDPKNTSSLPSNNNDNDTKQPMMIDMMDDNVDVGYDSTSPRNVRTTTKHDPTPTTSSSLPMQDQQQQQQMDNPPFKNDSMQHHHEMDHNRSESQINTEQTMHVQPIKEEDDDKNDDIIHTLKLKPDQSKHDENEKRSSSSNNYLSFIDDIENDRQAIIPFLSSSNHKNNTKTTTIGNRGIQNGRFPNISVMMQLTKSSGSSFLLRQKVSSPNHRNSTTKNNNNNPINGMYIICV